MGVQVKYFLYFLLAVFIQGSFAAIQNAQDRQFRYQASLRSTQFGQHACGGAIITEKWMITTAACANKLDRNSIAWAGTTKLLDDARSQTRQIKRVIRHEQFDANDFDNNIAVLEMTEPFVYNENILNVRLPIAGQALADTAQLCGWKSPNNYLQFLDNIQLQTSNCKTRGGVNVSLAQGEFCGHVQDESPANCINDLGGALSKDGVLHGLLSRTDCVSNPEIFVQISTYSDWIKTALGDDAKDIKWDQNYPGSGNQDPDGPGGASAAESSMFLVILLASVYTLLQNFYRS